MSTNVQVKKTLFNRTQIIGLVIAVIALVGMYLVPASEALGRPGINTLGVLVAIIAMLICRTLPMGVIGILAIPIFYFTGMVEKPAEALAGFSNPTTFFILASFGITAALVNTPVAKRMMRWVIHTFGRTTSGVLLAIMLTAGIVSSIMSNLPVVAAFLPLADQFVKLFPEGEKRTRTACAFFIGVPIAGMAGGMITPAGAAINVMVMDRLQSAANIDISFLAWMIIGAPLGILTILFGWFFLKTIYKPAQLTEEEISDYLESLAVDKKWSVSEKKVLLICGLMFVLWIASTWVSYLNTTIVALCGLFLFVCPGIGVMDFPAYLKECNWNLVFLFGSMTTMSGRLTANGVVKFLAEGVAGLQLGDINPMVMVFGITIVTWLLLLLMPIGNSLTNNLSVPLIAIALGLGVDPVCAVIPLLYCGLCAFMIPLDILPLMAYNYGYYTVGTQVKSTVPICLFISILTAIWVPLTCTFDLW